MLENIDLAITGDATGMMAAYGLGQLLVYIGFAALMGAVAYGAWQYTRLLKSFLWYATTRDAYRVGLVKKHANENNVTLCYEPTKTNERKGLMQSLDEDVKRDIGE